MGKEDKGEGPGRFDSIITWRHFAKLRVSVNYTCRRV